jgi:hypothetical protein
MGQVASFIRCSCVLPNMRLDLPKRRHLFLGSARYTQPFRRSTADVSQTA